ncbi:hypothetical protein [Vibrio parahaemolyticus]|uniref:hypothetical protein n=1 Tax=Vibrio parahaemolyticus TaxID=670 RepID=UPI0011EDAE60|nr:hypothetical protein [Vibrio parahaemolyticus]KAB5599277.1 hypothetical protein F0578_11675 [Vibrio parahaemolyticus]
MTNIQLIINGTKVFAWSNAADELLKQGVSDMALTLERMLPDSPEAVVKLTTLSLVKLPPTKNMTRIATLRTFKRRAEKLLAKSK